MKTITYIIENEVHRCERNWTTKRIVDRMKEIGARHWSISNKIKVHQEHPYLKKFPVDSQARQRLKEIEDGKNLGLPLMSEEGFKEFLAAKGLIEFCENLKG